MLFGGKERKSTRKEHLCKQSQDQEPKEPNGTQNSWNRRQWWTDWWRLKISSKTKKSENRNSSDFTPCVKADFKRSERWKEIFTSEWIYEAIGNKRKLTIQSGLKCSRLTHGDSDNLHALLSPIRAVCLSMPVDFWNVALLLHVLVRVT